MGNYNTFVVIDCNTRRTILTTTSARKARQEQRTGVKIEIWNNNKIVAKIYEADKRHGTDPFLPYITAEREYIKKKQAKAEARNRARKERLAERQK